MEPVSPSPVRPRRQPRCVRSSCLQAPSACSRPAPLRNIQDSSLLMSGTPASMRPRGFPFEAARLDSRRGRLVRSLHALPRSALLDEPHQRPHPFPQLDPEPLEPRDQLAEIKRRRRHDRLRARPDLPSVATAPRHHRRADLRSRVPLTPATPPTARAQPPYRAAQAGEAAARRDAAPRPGGSDRDRGPHGASGRAS